MNDKCVTSAYRLYRKDFVSKQSECTPSHAAAHVTFNVMLRDFSDSNEGEDGSTQSIAKEVRLENMT